MAAGTYPTREYMDEQQRLENCHGHLYRRIATLEQQVAALRVDAERYRWLRTRIIAADFDYDNSGEAAIVFSWPDKCSVSANIDASIDAAMGEKADAIRGLA